MSTSPGWTIEADVDDATAYAALARDRLWNGYSIADLIPPFRQYSQFAIARHADGAYGGLCLLLRHPAFSAMIPDGDPRAVAAILGAVDLPPTAYLLAHLEHVPTFVARYLLPRGRWNVFRMATDRTSFKPPPTGLPVTRLDRSHLAELESLHATNVDNVFHADQLDFPCFGVRVAGQLVAAAGTHVLAAEYGVAVIGNVFTAPEHRGRGLAAATTAATAAALFDLGCEDVILNVAVGNESAQRVYQRLGFHVHCNFWEAALERRPPPGEDAEAIAH